MEWKTNNLALISAFLVGNSNSNYQLKRTHIASKDKEEVPYCFSRSPIKFHCHTDQKVGFGSNLDKITWLVAAIALLVILDGLTDRLIFNMGIPSLGKMVFILRRGPGGFFNMKMPSWQCMVPIMNIRSQDHLIFYNGNPYNYNDNFVLNQAQHFPTHIIAFVWRIFMGFPSHDIIPAISSYAHWWDRLGMEMVSQKKQLLNLQPIRRHNSLLSISCTSPKQELSLFITSHTAYWVVNLILWTRLR